jgi:hypothetical protein
MISHQTTLFWKVLNKTCLHYPISILRTSTQQIEERGKEIQLMRVTRELQMICHRSILTTGNIEQVGKVNSAV